MEGLLEEDGRFPKPRSHPPTVLSVFLLSDNEDDLYFTIFCMCEEEWGGGEGGLFPLSEICGFQIQKKREKLQLQGNNKNRQALFLGGVKWVSFSLVNTHCRY